ncbi:glycosyltransferase [Agrobacterium salinitolerans]|uniref:Glycosyltransferase n=1 Tax=Agrobacterium salinitolerans TaxID=1183413 RepID=A0ABY3BMU3_9HYPH|nr:MULTISPECIES: glycosyltransferase [Agrobacterium]MCZ7891831.1 glycosyltransferase [Agrobacterium salinitolerans]TRA89455.1 glycosyltransferase [Agrobacterium salinitolerans]
MRNSFVYNEIEKFGLSPPDIDVLAQRYYAQCAEDLIVVSILKALSARRHFDLSAERYLEVGANHPIATSATYLLSLELGMSGVLVEANPALIADLEKVRKQDLVLNKAIIVGDSDTAELFVSNQNELSSLSRRFVEDWQDGAVGLKDVITVQASRMNDVLEEFFSERAPLYLSIDTEGLDLDLLKDVDWDRWRPAVVQAEPSEHFIENNAELISQLLESKGYVLVAKTAVNLIFMDSSLATKNSASQVDGDGAGAESVSGPTGVGIVTRTKDRAVLLRRALESVKNQTYEDWRLVVVNDGGQAESVDWLVGQIFEGDARVSVLHHEVSKGMEAASNAGLATLNTEYAVIHDDDDSWAPEFLASMTSTIARRQKTFPSIKGIVCRINTVFETVVGNEIIIERVEPFRSWHSDNLDEGLLSVQKMLVRNQFPPIAFMFNLPSAREIGLFEESLPVLGDWDFHSRFLLKHDVWVVPEFLSFYHHRVSSTGALGNTVHAGADRHRLYNQKIRNDLIRKVAGQNGENRMAITIPMEVQELTQNEFNHVLWRLWQMEEAVKSLRYERPRWRQTISRSFRRWRNRVLGRAIEG